MRSKYRLIQHEYIDEHGHMQTLYIPKIRVFFFFWCTLTIGEFGRLAIFKTMSEAKQFIANLDHLNGRLQKDTVIEEYI